MSNQAPSRGSGWAMIGLAIFVEFMAVVMLLADHDAVSPRGIPAWLIDVLLVPFGIWAAIRGIRNIRQPG
jgi:hypothetical protein